MLFIFLSVTLFLAFIVYKLTFSGKKLNLPPGPKAWPLVGNLLQVSRFPQETYTKWMEEYGDLYHVVFGADHVFVMSDVKMIKECYNQGVFTGRSSGMLTCILAKGKNGIVLSDGQTWVDQRRFTLRHLRDFGFGKNLMESYINDEVNDLIAGLKNEEGHPIVMNDRFSIAVINALWRVIAGKKFAQDDKEKMELLTEIDRTFARLTVCGVLYLMAPSLLKLAPGLLGYNHAVEVADRLHVMLKEEIEEHERTLPVDGNPRDFIDAFLLEVKRTENEDSSFYREAGITSLLANIGDLYFAGAETTNSTLSWGVLYLGLHPEVQRKFQQSIDSVVGSSRPVALSDRSNLPYVEATINEILRKSSIVVTGVFHTALEDAKFLGYDIPKNSWLVANQYAIHHNPKLWDEPEKFKPERFLSADEKTFVRNENMIAFSVGKRACIGETLARDEIFLFMTNIFQRFNITVDESKGKLDPSAKEGFILQPQDYSIIVKDRHS